MTCKWCNRPITTKLTGEICTLCYNQLADLHDERSKCERAIKKGESK